MEDKIKTLQSYINSKEFTKKLREELIKSEIRKLDNQILTNN
jgi:hypothetical protein